MSRIRPAIAMSIALALIPVRVVEAGDVVLSGAVRTDELRNNAGAAFFGTCSVGSSIRAIDPGGAVTCELDDSGGTDNLGNHVATQNLELNGHFVSGDGDDEGVWVSTNGNVGIGTAVTSSELLTINGNIQLPSTGQVLFGGALTRIYESGTNLRLAAEASSNADVELEANDNVEIQADNDIFILAGDDIFIEPDGNVGIGSIFGAPSNILTVEQGSATDPVADGWTTYSSARWKKEIRTLSNALGDVLALRGVSYTSGVTGERSIGVIAEEVAQVVPEIVAFEADGETPQAVDYGRLTALLIEAIKDQQAQIDFLLGVICRRDASETFCAR